MQDVRLINVNLGKKQAKHMRSVRHDYSRKCYPRDAFNGNDLSFCCATFGSQACPNASRFSKGTEGGTGPWWKRANGVTQNGKAAAPAAGLRECTSFGVSAYSFTLSTDTMLFSTSVQARTIQLRIPVTCGDTTSNTLTMLT